MKKEKLPESIYEQLLEKESVAYFIHLGLRILKRLLLRMRGANFGLLNIPPVRRGGTDAALKWVVIFIEKV